MARTKRISDEALLDAAMPALFAAGPREFTLAQVGAATGLSPATLVQRFGTKQGLVQAALTLANGRNLAKLDQLPEAQGVEAVISLFLERTPGPAHEHLLSDQLLWLREGMADDQINALTRRYFAKFREAVIARLPPLLPDKAEAAILLDALWHGSLIQWGIGREGHLMDHVERNLRSWFATASSPVSE